MAGNAYRARGISLPVLQRAHRLVLGLAVAAFVLGALSADIPESFRAREAHEGVTIAARPIPDAEEIFGKTAAPVRAGFLPVELLIAPSRCGWSSAASLYWRTIGSSSRLSWGEIALALYPLPKADPAGMESADGRPACGRSRLPTRLG